MHASLAFVNGAGDKRRTPVTKADPEGLSLLNALLSTATIESPRPAVELILPVAFRGTIQAEVHVQPDAPATPAQKKRLSKLSPQQIGSKELAGDRIEQVLDRAPGNGAPIGGIKVIASSGWFAARPSGTENIYKIYAESFRDESHLQAIVAEARQIVNNALGGA